MKTVVFKKTGRGRFGIKLKLRGAKPKGSKLPNLKLLSGCRERIRL